MTSFGELGRRISAWTTRLLLSVLVVLAGWGFGRQVMEWWAAEPAGKAASEPVQGLWEELAAWEPPLRLSDGHWTMAWQGTAASQDEAMAMLRARCQTLVAGAPLPAEPPGPAEQHLLAILSGSVPVAEQPGRWTLYQKEGPLALVVGTRPAGVVDTASASGPPLYRVVVWGLALPHGEQGWAAYAFHPVAGRSPHEEATQQPQDSKASKDNHPP